MGAHYDKALILYRQKRFEPARRELARELAESPRSAWAHALLALCLAWQKQFKEAREAAESAIALDPQCAFAHRALAQTFYLDRRYACRREKVGLGDPISLRRRGLELAESSAKEALRLTPRDAELHGLVAFIYLESGRVREGLRQASEGLALDPRDTDCLRAQAIATRSLDRSQAALDASADAVKANPEGGIEHAIHGRSLLISGRRAEAMVHFEQAMRLEPVSPFVQMTYLDGVRAQYLPYLLFLRFQCFRSVRTVLLCMLTVLLAPIGAMTVLMLLKPGLAEYAGTLYCLAFAPGALFFMSRLWIDFFLQFNPAVRGLIPRDQLIRADLFVVLSVAIMGSAVREIAKPTRFDAAVGRAWWVSLGLLVAVFFWLRSRTRHSRTDL